MPRRRLCRALLGAATMLTGWPAAAQFAGVPEPAGVDEATRCQQQVHHYEENLRRVRTILGTTAYQAMRARQLPEAERDELLFKGGYCEVARVLRERKLIQ